MVERNFKWMRGGGGGGGGGGGKKHYGWGGGGGRRAEKLNACRGEKGLLKRRSSYGVLNKHRNCFIRGEGQLRRA